MKWDSFKQALFTQCNSILLLILGISTLLCSFDRLCLSFLISLLPQRYSGQKPKSRFRLRGWGGKVLIMVKFEYFHFSSTTFPFPCRLLSFGNFCKEEKVSGGKIERKKNWLMFLLKHATPTWRTAENNFGLQASEWLKLTFLLLLSFIF